MKKIDEHIAAYKKDLIIMSDELSKLNEREKDTYEPDETYILQYVRQQISQLNANIHIIEEFVEVLEDIRDSNVVKITLPDFKESDVEIIWLYKTGDTVIKGDAVAEMVMDKAYVTIDAPGSGILYCYVGGGNYGPNTELGEIILK